MDITTFKHWWLVALKGLAIFLFGILVWLYPIEVTESFLIIYALFIGIGGIFVLTFAFKNPKRHIRKWFLVEGLIDIGIALIIILYPYKTATFLALLFGIWLFFNAVFQLHVARRRYLAKSEWKMRLANGLLILVFSIMLMTYPLSDILTFAYLLGITSAAFGLFLIIIALRCWRHEANLKHP